MRIQSHKDLRVWQKSIDLAEHVYRATENFPQSEIFGLAGQARRAATSVPANIAEGYGRESTRSYLLFLKTARGSLLELETHVILAERVGLLERNQTTPLLAESENIGRMLYGLIKSLKEGAPQSRRHLEMAK
ncbi:MAG: four helix bundle protein [Hyphomicrobium sp.]